MDKGTPNLKKLATGLALAVALVVAGLWVAVSGADDAKADDVKVVGISVDALQKLLSTQAEKPLLVDVREPHEYEEVHIDGVLLAPLATVEAALKSTDRKREIVLICRSGRRSAKAFQSLAAEGFTNMKNLEGGMIAWEKAGYAVVKKQ